MSFTAGVYEDTTGSGGAQEWHDVGKYREGGWASVSTQLHKPLHTRLFW